MIMAPILTSFYDFANNYALKLVIDTFEKNPSGYQAFLKPVLLFITAQILIDVIWRLSDIAEWKSEPYVRKAILNHVYDYVQHNPYSFFQNTPQGSINSRIKGILDGYDNFWAAMHHDFTPRIANSLVLTCMLAVVNVKVFLMVALWALCFLLIMYYLSTKLGQLSYINANHRHEILGSIFDNIANITSVFSFASKKKELVRLSSEIDKNFIPSGIKVYKFTFYSLCFAAVMYWSMLISLFIYMIYLRQNNQASSGDVVFVISLTIKMSWDLWQLIQRMQIFMKNIGDFKSAFSLLQNSQNEPASLSMPMIKITHPSIKFAHISFAYQQNSSVFNNLNLSIKAGEKLGLVGMSGAGKSTLISLLLKYFSPDAGKIFIDDQDIALFSSDSVREYISLIPQDVVLFHRSIKENIAYGSDADMNSIIHAAKMANIHDHIIKLPDAYNSLVGERGVKLSGGQRQRIAIARAIVKNAPILILDEATSSLDTKTEYLIQDSINNLLAQKQTTVIAIAHRLSTLKHMDRIVVLEHGIIKEEGHHEELIKQGQIYQKLWELQKI